MENNKIYYFLHPYFTEDDRNIVKNVNNCLKYVSVLKSLGYYVYAPTAFFYLFDTRDEIEYSAEDLRDLDSKFLEKMDGLIISPYYSKKSHELGNIKKFFKLKELPILWYEDIVI